jgi:hypothetical protein
VFRRFRPALLPTVATRDLRRLSLLATVRQEVLGVSGDQTSGSSDSQSTCSDDKAVCQAETYAHGSIRCRFAPAKMLKRIAAVSPH